MRDDILLAALIAVIVIAALVYTAFKAGDIATNTKEILKEMRKKNTEKKE